MDVEDERDEENIGSHEDDEFESIEFDSEESGSHLFGEVQEGVHDDDAVEMAKEESESADSGETVETAGTELEEFEAAEIEEREFIEAERVESIIESLLFAQDRPISLNMIRQVFRGTNVNSSMVRDALEVLKVEYAGARRGISLDEVGGGYQLRTKLDNMNYLKQIVKGKVFRLSGPALEVLSIVAYKQPVVKSEIDAIRGVESGHLLRGLMERSLVCFDGKSELPGKPMNYGTTRKFLEIFGLRNLKELPSVSEIDDLLPDGIGEEESRPLLGDLTHQLSEEVQNSYSVGEEELTHISEQLDSITTTSDFFEQEKQRQRMARDAERAQSLRESMLLGETLPEKDLRWLQKYEASVENREPASSAESMDGIAHDDFSIEYAQGKVDQTEDQVTGKRDLDTLAADDDKTQFNELSLDLDGDDGTDGSSESVV